MRVIDAIIDRYQNFVQGSKSNCVFLDGPAGSGKTCVFLTLHTWCLENQKKNRVIASSGGAASQLPNGTKQFACFGLTIGLTNQAIFRFSGLSVKAKALKMAGVFIWVETTMSPGKALTDIEQSLEDSYDKNTVDLFVGFFVLFWVAIFAKCY